MVYDSEFYVKGLWSYGGEPQEGIYETTGPGLYVDIDTMYELLNRISDLERGAVDFHSMGRELAKQTNAKKIAEKEKKFAQILAMALRGQEIWRIRHEMEKVWPSCSYSLIGRALFVGDEVKDYDRLRSLMKSYPEEFEGISVEDFDKWFRERRAQYLKKAKKS